ncbi:MAG: GNAT family N-acetyltransferase [Aureispira sp.]|nr:GNAT family N-acetyltransferase [Aureispira sp.]
MQISTITKDNIHKLSSLLSASYGEPIEIQDELDYFPKETIYWYVAFQEETPLGFIRHFKIGESTKHQLELYALDLATKKRLLLYFLKQVRVSVLSSIRLYVKKEQYAFVDFLETLDFEMQEEYLELAYKNLIVLTRHKGKTRLAENTAQEVLAIQTILYENFGLISINRIKQQIKEQIISVIENKDGNIVGVCLFGAQEKEKEIIQIAVQSKHRQQGYGTVLLSHTMGLLQEKNSEMTFFLRVKTKNKVAIQMYKSIGFEKIGTEQWFVKKLN